MGISKNMWEAITTVIRMNDKIEHTPPSRKPNRPRLKISSSA